MHLNVHYFCSHFNVCNTFTLFETCRIKNGIAIALHFRYNQRKFLRSSQSTYLRILEIKQVDGSAVSLDFEASLVDDTVTGVLLCRISSTLCCFFLASCNLVFLVSCNLVILASCDLVILVSCDFMLLMLCDCWCLCDTITHRKVLHLLSGFW